MFRKNLLENSVEKLGCIEPTTGLKITFKLGAKIVYTFSLSYSVALHNFGR